MIVDKFAMKILSTLLLLIIWNSISGQFIHPESGESVTYSIGLKQEIWLDSVNYFFLIVACKEKKQIVNHPDTLSLKEVIGSWDEKFENISEISIVKDSCYLYPIFYSINHLNDATKQTQAYFLVDDVDIKEENVKIAVEIVFGHHNRSQVFRNEQYYTLKFENQKEINEIQENEMATRYWFSKWTKSNKNKYTPPYLLTHHIERACTRDVPLPTEDK